MLLLHGLHHRLVPKCSTCLLLVVLVKLMLLQRLLLMLVLWLLAPTVVLHRMCDSSHDQFLLSHLVQKNIHWYLLLVLLLEPLC